MGENQKGCEGASWGAGKVLDLDVDGGYKATHVCENLCSCALGFVHFSVLSYTSKNTKLQNPSSATLPLSVCFCFCETRAVTGLALLRKGFKRMVCTQAVHKPGRQPVNQECRARQSRNAPGLPHTLALCGPQFPHLQGASSLHLARGSREKEVTPLLSKPL